ncbi:unnamed protein product [Paramecium octaurelia]|uniref:HOOK N-terminal domain-containing protein n=1 Tax=Paramecium octaurelia TaxID=43137 RepID=A0A8S1ULP1_PAROT|nr:unnamed protein product [Paramecium octaurelia]
MSLENAIVQWLNKYQQLNIQSFESLADGCAFSQLLNLVDPTFFSLASARNLKIDIDAQKVQGHLIDMLQKVQQYRTNIQCKPPDYIEIDVFEIAVKQNKQQILALFELIMKVILSSNLRGKFIEPILMLEEKVQETLMHFLKNHLDESENQTNEWQEENYIQSLVQKMDEIETQNTELKQLLNESEEKQKTLKCALDDALVQMENKEMEIKALTESKCHLEKCLEEKMDFQLEFKESEKIHQKCLEQEHKLAQYELIIEDLKRKEIQFVQLKEEYQQNKYKLQENEKLEQKIESLQERRELDKDVYQKGKERYEKEVATLKQNIKELLIQQSELKESKLNLELELQQNKARLERSQEQIKTIETEYGQKIRELQVLLETLHQAEDEDMPNMTSSTDQQLSQEMKLSTNAKNENFEREYYIKENHKLEEKLKECQAKMNEMQMELESKNQKSKFESQLQQSQQISLLTDKIKQFQEHNQQLKKQNEELKKQTQNKKVTQIDYEISVLSLLSDALAKKVKDTKSQEKE